MLETFQISFSTNQNLALKVEHTMADDTADGLFAIEVGADDYAETAANDAPKVSRTFQSEADFQAQKASYTAQIDGDGNYEKLLKAVPALRTSSDGDCAIEPKVKLGKRDVALVGYTVGELYYDREYSRVIQLCKRLRGVCQVDGKLGESLERWTARCEDRLKDS